MDTRIETFRYPDGNIQRVQLVRWDAWEELDFLEPRSAPEALECFVRIYRQFLVPACPWIFGNMVLFRLPEGMKVPFSRETGRYGTVADACTAAAAALERGVRIRKGRPVFRDPEVRRFWNMLEDADALRIVSGKLPVTTVIPVGNYGGFLSQAEPEAALKVNASFFIMDRFDCATAYDALGTPIGLCVKDGRVLRPPMYRREALLVRKDGRVSVEMPDVRELTLEIGGKAYRHGENAHIDTRPGCFLSAGRGTKLVIVGDRVAAVSAGGPVPVPASGFVLRIWEDCAAAPGDRVVYRGFEDVRFGIQVGNSVIKNGVRTERFLSRFYQIRRLEPVPYPPSLYPMNFRKDRAARIALGADAQGRPMLLWAEGAAKIGHRKGQDSRGATLEDMAVFCREMGMANGVNLDGGGSAQLLLGNRRALRISDRKETDGSEMERPVPLGLIVR